MESLPKPAPRDTSSNKFAVIIGLFVVSALIAVVGLYAVYPKRPPITVTAVRAGPDLPTYLQVDPKDGPALAVGQRLKLVRDGKTVAEATVELADAQRATVRILPETWVAGADRSIATGEQLTR